MKKITIALGALALTGFAASAHAGNDEFLAACNAYSEANNQDTNCTCLDEAASKNPSLYDEYAKVSKPEDAATLSDDAKEVIAQCSTE